MKKHGDNRIYWDRGDRVQFTGKSETLYGGLFHEVEVLEGHQKGKLRLLSDEHCTAYMGYSPYLYFLNA